ncbi:MAG: replicative DNA helicase, partial [Thermoanaerobaculum sp.]|nr:replicative DNA helicase [Thermoanaerobaculum sp.]MDW7967851.1 replicative DNA helicase [Thermoanaerobaculum sp.]
PFSESAERAILGAILNEGSCFFRVVDLIGPEDFYLDQHRLVFEAFIQLAHENAPIDLLSTLGMLERLGTVKAVGGAPFLAQLAQDLPDPEGVEHYAEIVRDKAIRRQLLKMSTTLMVEAGNEGGRALDLLDRVETMVLEVADRAIQTGPRKVGDLAAEELHHLEVAARSEHPFVGLETGFRRLDELTSGLKEQELIILAARPGVGKTAMALNIASHVALRLKKRVLFFSLEMSASALVRRLLAAEAKVSLQRIINGRISLKPSRSLSDLDRLVSAADALGDAPLWIDDSATLSLLELRGKARRMMMEHGLDLVVVDYLQLMSSGQKTENRTQEVSAISRGLKAIAKQLRVPVLALSQLSRQPERRGADARPQLSDLRESGSIEQDADVVIFIHRKVAPRAEGESTEESRKAEVIVAKQRNGPTDAFILFYLEPYTLFSDPEFHDEAYGPSF